MAYKKLDDERYAKLVDAVNKLPSANATTNLSRTKPTSSAPNMPSFTPNHRDLDSIQTDLTAAKRVRSGLLNDFGFEPVDLSQFRVDLDTANQNVNRYKSEKLIEDKVYQSDVKQDTFVDQFSASKTMGRLTQNQSRAWNEYLKNPTPENRKTAQSYDKAIEDYAKKNKIALDDQNVKLGIISQSYANYLPQQVDQLKAQVPGAVIGGLAGLAVGKPVSGMRVGASITSGADMFEITRGAAFKRFIDMGVDEETARALATDEGIVQGILEGGDTYLDWLMFGGKALAPKLLPSLSAKASTAAGKTALAKVIKQIGGKIDNLPTAVKVAGAYGVNIPQEGLEEGSQEVVSLANDRRVETGETGVWNLMKNSLGLGADLLSGKDYVVGYDQNGKPIMASEQVKQAGIEGMKIAAVSGGMQAIGGYAAQRALTPKPAKGDNKNTPAPVSPAASPEVQQVQVQAEVTKAQNPEAEVLDAATTMFTQQGMNLKTAQKRAEIVGKLIRGEEVSDKDLNRIDPTSNQTKQIFTQLTGVQFPEGKIQIEKLRDLYRSAHTVAENARVESDLQRSLSNANAMNAKFERNVSLAKQMEQSGYQTSPETQTRIDEENSKLANQVANLDIGPDGKPLASLSTFAEAYRSKIDPNATDEVVREKYAEFRNASRTILFGGHRLTKNQFTKLMRDNGKNLTDEQVNTLFNQAILDTLDGKDAFDRYTKKEAKTDDRTDARAEDGNSGQVVREQSDRRGDRDGGRQSGVDDASDRRGSRETPGQSAHLQSGQDQHVGRLSGLDNPRTRKTKIPGVKGTVEAVLRSDYTDEMWTAHMIARELGFKLNVVTRSFSAKFANGYSRCIGLADRKNRIFTVSAESYKQTNFWVTFRHELFHLFAGDKTFMKDFLRGMAEATSGQSDVAYFLHDEIHRNDYLAPYRDEFDKYDLSTRERNLLLLEEMCAELLAGNNDGLKLSQQTFDTLHEAAVKVFDEVSPKYESKIKEKVLADRLETKGYKIAEQQDAVDSKRSDEVERPDRAFALSKEQFWDEQIDGLSDNSTFDAMYIKETPNILAEIGLGDLPMCMTKSHARDSLHAKGDDNMHWHGVPESVMMRLPDLLSTPAMVLNSQTKRGDILVVLNAVDNDGLPIVAAIHPNGRATVDGERGPANFILSVYGRSNFAPQPGVDGKNNLLYLALKDKNILYWNKKRTETLFHNAGLQLPRTMEKVPSDTILKQYRGYVKDRIPERMFSLSKYDDIEAKLDEIEQKNKALSDLVAKLEEAFPSEADYNFSTWMNAMHYLDNTSTTKLGFDMPMPFDDEVDVGYMHNGEWVSVATFENSKDGLKKFNQELSSLIQAEAEAEAVEDDIDDLPDEWLLEDDHFEDLSFLDIYDDSTQYHGEDDESMYYRNIMNERSLSDRTGFTDTDSKAFQKWFNDDSGMLTGKDGKPRIFLRGTQYAGATKMRDSSGAKSRGLFFTLRQDIAEQYANGLTVGGDEHVTAMDRLKGTSWNKAEREWKPHNFKTWNNARKYIEETFTDDGGYNGIELVGIDGETGEIVPSSRATQFILRTNITTQNHRLSTPGLPLFTEDGFRELKSYPATKAGLTQLNKDLGDFVRELGMGMRGYSKFYLSAENTFVFDAQNADYGYLPDDRLPEKLKSGHTTGTQSINGLAERAFAAGYDCVIVTNVNDAGGLQTQYVVKNPTQVKSVYNRGTWNRREPDFMFSLAKEDYLMDYLDNVEMEYGGDFAQELFDAFETADLSKRIAEVMSEIEASVGAAKSGFDPYSHLQNEYGTMEPGEKPARTVDMPKQTKDNNKVGQTPRTVMEAEATPESRIESIEQAVVDHKFSYKEGHNKIRVRRAEAAIRKDGWAESLTNWTRDVRDGKVNADLVAMGAVLLDNAGNSDMAGERYVQLVVDYHDLLHAAGQATQAARILKNLTPGARLYGLRGYAKNMTERIRKGDPAHNIPVEKWMEVTGNLLADRLRTKLNVPKKHAKTVSQTILSDLNAFAKTAFPEQEKTPGRTEMDRINDLFDNYEKYKEAWDAAKETIKKEYADMPEALEVFNNFLETDLADTFIGQYFGHPEIRIDQALQQKFLSAKTDEERDAVTEEITKNIAQQIPATFMDKFTALRYLNMLGNFKTQIRNVTGNAFNAGLTKGKNQVATLIELAVIKAGGKIERTKSFKKDPEVYRAALKDAEKMMDAILAGGKYEDGRRFDTNIEKYRTIFKNKALEKYRRLTNEAMSRGDAVFSKIAYADALAGYLSAHGKTFETAGTELLDNARAYALKQAAEATFRDSNMFSDAIVAMRFRNPDTIAKKALNMIGEGILPFRKTPANILVRAVEYSPVGVITTMAETVYGKKTGTFNANKLIDSLAKNATGTMIFAVGALLSNLGLLKGKEPDEDKEKEFDALTGHQAYSIELPNGMSLTLDWLAPSSVPLFLGAQFAENAADAGLSFRDVLTAMGAITDPMLQMSMLQGLDDALANASTYGDDSALVRFTGNALWSFLTQGLTNTMLGQLERSLSNERSTTYRDKHKDVPDGIQYLIGKTLEKVPLPGADYGQIPYIDAWGRIETNARTNFGNVLNQFFVPSYVSWVEESKMEKELRRLYEANPDENASVLISRPKSYFNVDNKRKDLTAEEFIEYATTRGQTAYNVATDLTESEIYGTLSDKQKAEAVLKAYDFANQMAKAVTTGYTPDKWDEDAPEGSVNPDNWVKEAMTCATEYGVPVGEYAAIYAATKDLESYKNSKGETVDNSKSLKVAVAIYDMGLSDAETKSLLEAFGVNQTVRKYSEKTACAKLKAMKEKYE